MFLWRSF